MRKLATAVVAALSAALLAAVLSVLLGACSSSGSHPSTTSSSEKSGSATSGANPSITISSFNYSGDLTVKAGATVTVVNKDSVPHSLTDKASGKFDTGVLQPGATGTFTAPSKAGSYPFGCRIHPEMKGTLVVQ